MQEYGGSESNKTGDCRDIDEASDRGLLLQVHQNEVAAKNQYQNSQHQYNAALMQQKGYGKCMYKLLLTFHLHNDKTLPYFSLQVIQTRIVFQIKILSHIVVLQLEFTKCLLLINSTRTPGDYV